MSSKQCVLYLGTTETEPLMIYLQFYFTTRKILGIQRDDDLTLSNVCQLTVLFYFILLNIMFHVPDGKISVRINLLFYLFSYRKETHKCWMGRWWKIGKIIILFYRLKTVSLSNRDYSLLNMLTIKQLKNSWLCYIASIILYMCIQNSKQFLTIKNAQNSAWCKIENMWYQQNFK